MYPKAQRQN